MNWILINEMLCCEACWSCICDNANAWIALTGIALSFIGVLLSFVGLRQIGKTREAVAYSQVKVQQTETMNKLLVHLNRLVLNVHLCSFDDKSTITSYKYYKCNIFELKLILDDETYNRNTNVLFHNFRYSLLLADEFFTQGFLDKKVANALILFDPKTSTKEADKTIVSGKGAVLIEGEKNEITSGITQEIKLYEINNSNVNNSKSLVSAINALEIAIKDWYKENGIKDGNLLINPSNLHPLYPKKTSTDQ